MDKKNNPKTIRERLLVGKIRCLLFYYFLFYMFGILLFAVIYSYSGTVQISQTLINQSKVTKQSESGEERKNPNQFGEKTDLAQVTFWDCLSFSAATQATMGLSDTSPKDTLGKWLFIFQCTIFVFFPAISIGLLVYKMTVHTSNIKFADIVCWDAKSKRFSYRFWFKYPVEIVDIKCEHS